MNKTNGLLSPFAHRIYIVTGVLIFALLYLYEVSELTSSQDKLLVNPVIWIIIILYPLIIWQEWREHKKNTKEDSSKHIEEENDDSMDTSAVMTKKIFYFMVLTLGYLILINYFGFFIMTILYLPLLMWNLGTKSKRMLIILPIVTTVSLFVLFNFILSIPLPEGLLLQGVFE